MSNVDEQPIDANEELPTANHNPDDTEPMKMDHGAAMKRTESLKLRSDNLQIERKFAGDDDSQQLEARMDKLRRRSQLADVDDQQTLTNGEVTEMSPEENDADQPSPPVNEATVQEENDESSEAKPTEEETTVVEVTNAQREASENDASPNEINAEAEEETETPAAESVSREVSVAILSESEPLKRSDMTLTDDRAGAEATVEKNTTMEEPIPMIDEGSPVVSDGQGEMKVNEAAGSEQVDGTVPQGDTAGDLKMARLRQRIKQACTLV